MGSDLTALLERVEKATEPDRRLADDVMLALGWRTNYELKPRRFESYEVCANQACWYRPGSTTWIHGHQRPDPSASIDAALALVAEKLPGWSWNVMGRDDGKGPYAIAQVARVVGDDVQGGDAVHDRAPLAILAALLKALIAQQAKGEDNGK